MMKTKKGQVALESMFVVLFIVVAITQIITLVTAYSNDIEKMSIIRTELQGFALERSLDGETTHLIRVDPYGSTSEYDVYFASEDCTGITGIGGDMDLYGFDMSVMNDIKCNEGLTGTTDFFAY